MASCALLLSLSSMAYADEAVANPDPVPEREKAYTLTRVESAGKNTITKIELNTDTGKFEPVYYRLDLVKTEYGKGELTKSFTLTYEPVKDVEIIVHYATSNPQTRFENTTDNSSTAIVGQFIEQNATGSGGAIDNSGKLGNINADFISNSAEVSGGAILNSAGYRENSVIGDITGNFIDNSAGSGGAISNVSDMSGISEVGNITGNFIRNSAGSDGGAIYNSAGYASYGSIIGNITGDFINNSAQNSGGAIYKGASDAYQSSKISNITGNFIGNMAGNNGGAICHYSKLNSTSEIGDITGDFINNSAGEGSGGAIYNYSESNSTSEIGDISGDFINNSAREGSGGAIYNENGEIGTIENSSFICNSAISEFYNAKGGAIYSKNSIINIAATRGYISRFEGNYTENSGIRDDNAIYLDTTDLNFTMSSGGQVVMKDSITGINYNVNITGDDIDNTRFYMHNDIKDANLTLANTTIDTIDNNIRVYDVQNLRIAQDTKMVADVDLQNQTMDRFTSADYGKHQGNLIVSGLNLISDAPLGRDVTEIYFAENGLKNNVLNNTNDLPDGSQTSFYTPIYKYNAEYDIRDAGGYFIFSRGGIGSNNPSNNFNPAVFSPSVAAQAGAYATQMQTFNYAFQHLDNFMTLPYFERLALKESGRYASAATNSFSPLYTRIESAGYWVKPYVSFESIPLKNGPKVDNINYGSLIGYDSKIQPIAHGFDRVLSGYVGYNGASQSYSRVDSYQNGGLIGGTVFLYKGNFFNATTISAGASVGESQNMYGNENYTMLLAGIGNRLGYNFEFKEGKYIIQPSMLMSYTFVNTFDYTNSAGVQMKSDPLHAIQLAPGVKFIMNTKNGWQPYAAVNMVWNILDKTDVRANDVRLPKMSIKPYVQYGLGVQKRIKDRFLAFGQAMVSNGGRNGVSLSFGLRWFIGD